MKFKQILLIFRARARVLFMTLGLTVLAGVAISLLLPKRYEGTTSLVVNMKGADPVAGMLIPALLSPGYLATQVDIIQSKAVAMRVVDALHLAEADTAKEEFQEATNGEGDIRSWLADLLLKRLNVLPARESSVITITFMGENPEFAAAVANAFADEYEKTSVQLKVQPLKQASAYFNDQIRDLRDKLETAQAKLSKYQQVKGVVSVDNRLDVESARLNELSSQLAMVQGQVADAQSRQSTKQGATTESPDVVANPLVQNLKASLSQAEANLSQLGEHLDVNHPQYLAAKAEVEKRRTELAAQVGVTYGSLGNSARIARQRQVELEAAVTAQRTRILELNRERDELSVLTREVDGAQRAYDAMMARFSQTSMEGGSNQADVAVLSPALPAMKPSSPKLVLNILLSIIFGTGLGMGLALVLEMFDQRVHGADDVLGMEILVLSDWSKPRKRKQKRGFLKLADRLPGRRPRIA